MAAQDRALGVSTYYLDRLCGRPGGAPRGILVPCKIYFWTTTSAAWHFDIPAWNYLGWLLTTFVIVFVNQRIDEALVARGIHDKPAFNLPNRCLWSLGYYIGNFVFISLVNIYLFLNPDVPKERHVGLILINTLGLVASFIIFSLLLLRTKLTRSAVDRVDRASHCA